MPPRPSATSVRVHWTPTPSISSSTSPRNAKPTCPSSSSSSQPRTKSSTPAKPSGKRGATKAPSATFASLRCFFWDAARTQCSTRWWSKRVRSFTTSWLRTSSTRTTTSLSKRWWECAGWPLSATKPSTWWKRTAISSWTWTTWCINSWSQPPNLDGGTSRDTSSTADPFGTCAASGTCPETFTPRASTLRFAPALGMCSRRMLQSSFTRLPCTPDSCIWRMFMWGCFEEAGHSPVSEQWFQSLENGLQSLQVPSSHYRTPDLPWGDASYLERHDQQEASQVLVGDAWGCVFVPFFKSPWCTDATQSLGTNCSSFLETLTSSWGISTIWKHAEPIVWEPVGECAIRVNIMLVCQKLVEFLLVQMHSWMSLIGQFSLHIILVVQTKVPLLCLLCGSVCIVYMVRNVFSLKKISVT